ncbi:MAG: heme exporter protein CcmD [Ottowia sp.]|nr:heme exporter protein CcmD [Ottowia sp.]
MIYWHSLSDFLHMGGYAGYVWGSVAMTAAVMALEIGRLRLKQRRLLRQGTGDQA